MGRIESSGLDGQLMGIRICRVRKILVDFGRRESSGLGSIHGQNRVQWT